MMRQQQLFALFAIAILSTRLAAATQYSVRDLGDSFFPIAMTDVGQIVGQGELSGTATAFLLDGGTVTPIIHPGGGEVRVSGINNLGQVVGANRDAHDYDHAFVWDQMTGWKALAQGDVNGSWANGINDAGIVVGDLYGDGALWQTNGDIVRLGDLGGAYSAAFALNSRGDVVGLSSLDPAGVQQHAFIWNQNAMQDMGVTDSITKGFQDYAIARDINDRGQVVGYAVGLNENNNPEVPDNGFIWDEANGLESLVPGVRFRGINNAGHAVGISFTQHRQSTGASWDAMLYENGALYNLNDLITRPSDFYIMTATGINEAGQIIAWGDVSSDNGTSHGFLLTPIPEPSAVCLLAIGLTVGYCRKRIRA